MTDRAFRQDTAFLDQSLIQARIVGWIDVIYAAPEDRHGTGPQASEMGSGINAPRHAGYDDQTGPADFNGQTLSEPLTRSRRDAGTDKGDAVALQQVEMPARPQDAGASFQGRQTCRIGVVALDDQMSSQGLAGVNLSCDLVWWGYFRSLPSCAAR